MSDIEFRSVSLNPKGHNPFSLIDYPSLLKKIGVIEDIDEDGVTRIRNVRVRIDSLPSEDGLSIHILKNGHGIETHVTDVILGFDEGVKKFHTIFPDLFPALEKIVIHNPLTQGRELQVIIKGKARGRSYKGGGMTHHHFAWDFPTKRYFQVATRRI